MGAPLDEVPTLVLEKHKKYRQRYGENETFWGFGIEIETYLQFVKPMWVATPVMRTARKPERYSVDYYRIYKTAALAEFDRHIPDASGFLPLPLLLNGHSFTKADRHGNHATTYTKEPKPNPKFSGRTLFQEFQEFWPGAVHGHEETFTFDGDTLEFMTQNFYKATIRDTVRELCAYKKEFLAQFNRFLAAKKIFLDRGPVMYPPHNPPFAVFHTNPKNVAMFNNGTYHINITLPSLLGPKSPTGVPTLVNPGIFKQQHRSCIRIFQWLEPILIGMFGTADPIPLGSKGSQRCAVSRYIGVGTYDTVAMPSGKIVGIPIAKVRGSDQPFWWYKVFHEGSAYNPLDEIGLDINYNKHFLHGIELRIFDWFPERFLEEVSEVLVLCAEASLMHKNLIEPATSVRWNSMMVDVLRHGKDTWLSPKELGVLEYVFGVAFPPACNTLPAIYDRLKKGMREKYGGGGIVRKFMSSKSCICMPCMP